MKHLSFRRHGTALFISFALFPAILSVSSVFADDGSFTSSGKVYGADIPEINAVTYQSNTTFPTGERYLGWTIGGLSGIDWDQKAGNFITARDNTRPGAGPNGAEQTSLFTVIPVFTAGEPGYSIQFTGVTPLNNPTWQPETDGLESVRHDPSGNGLWLSSESENVLYHLHSDGVTRDTIKLPYTVTGSEGNVQLEGLTFTPAGGLWVIREAPRDEDNGITRISQLSEDGKVLGQYPYRMDNITGNGVSELLAVSNNSFLVMERSFDGIGTGNPPTGEPHNSIRIYRVDLTGAPDISSQQVLKPNSVQPVTKTLIFDSKDIASVLNTWDTKIDNVEGMSFGPTLPDGHTSLILVSDNNFSVSQHKTQFIVFKLDSPLPNQQYWDGNTPMADGLAGGGNGIWRLDASTENWTRDGGNINDNWGGKTAIFQGMPGMVNIDNTGGIISASALRFLVSGYTLSGQALTLDPAGLTVDVPGSNDIATLDAPLSGDSTLIKIGTGALIINGTSTASGPAQVNAGRLTVNGTFPASITVLDSAILGGSGRTGAITVNSGGTVSPGNSVGTLTSLSDITFESGSHYAVELSPDGRSDQLHSEGRATLKGGEVNVLSENTGNLLTQSEVRSLEGKHFRILDAAQGVSGRFSSVSPSYLFLGTQLDYDNTGVILTTGRNATSFASVATTVNERAVARAIDSLAAGHPVQESLLEMNQPQEARKAFDALDGQLHANMLSTLVDENALLGSILNDHLQESSNLLTSSAPQTDDGEIWGQILGNQGNSQDQNGITGYDDSTYGALFGFDKSAGNNLRTGAGLGYTRTSLDSEHRGNGKSDNGWLAGYGNWSPGALSINAGAVLGWHRISTDRSVSYGSQYDKDTARYNARSAHVFADMGYNLLSGPSSLSPFAGVNYTTLNRGAFNENGGSTTLNAKDEEMHALLSEAGLRGNTRWQLASGASINTSAQVGWLHQLDSLQRDATLRFNNSDDFTVQAPGASRNALTLKAGVTWQGGANLSVSLGWSGLLSATRQANTADASVRWSF